MSSTPIEPKRGSSPDCRHPGTLARPQRFDKAWMKEKRNGSHNGTGNLIAADKVQGTNVYNITGDNLGSIHDLMIDKATGKVAYAIMAFGGFLGIGNQYHPLPWSLLK
jgi:hypothetical protein